MTNPKTLSRQHKVDCLVEISQNCLKLVLLPAKARDKIDGRRFKEISLKIYAMLKEAEIEKSKLKRYT